LDNNHAISSNHPIYLLQIGKVRHKVRAFFTLQLFTFSVPNF
jgi:hypothetical protein